MKRFIFIIPLVILSLIYFAYENKSTLARNNSLLVKDEFKSSPTNDKKVNSDYRFKVIFLPKEKLLKVSERIIWRNLTSLPTGELQFHLYPNALANNKSEFARRFYLSAEERTKIEIEKLIVSETEVAFEYFNPEVPNQYDSTVARVYLNTQVSPGDSVLIQIDYKLKIPRAVHRFGYASGTEFYFISQWFPKLGVFKDGKWTCSQYHSNTEFYSDFSNYRVEVTAPKEYKLGGTGKITKAVLSGNDKLVEFEAKKVIDFAWTASTDFESVTKTYNGNTNVEIEFLIQPENSNLIDRKVNAAINAISFLEQKIGEFPYPKITLVDVPRTSNIGGMEYPQIVTYFTPLFAPIEVQRPESTIIHEIVHQYFYAAVSSNEVYEAWLDEGLTTYLEEKILDKYYGKPELMFRFIDYYPVFGINFLSFNEIPIIYSLRDLPYEHHAVSMAAYYRNNNLGAISDTSFKLPNRLSYGTNAYYTPNLILRTLEGYLGEDRVLNILANYYKQNKFGLVTSQNLVDHIEDNIPAELTPYLNDFIYKNNKYDYRLSSISKTDSNTYRIFAERLEEGIAPVDIALYTETDTTIIQWDGIERWKEFEIDSKDEILAGEIDPQRKNKFDLNYANNSYVIEDKYWGSLSFAIRWFFWIQNALLIFGSIG